MAPLQELERGTATGMGWEQMNDNATALGSAGQAIDGDCFFPLGGHDRHDPSLDHEPSPLRVSAQLHAPRR